jgi:hypothetical protein
MNCLRHLEHWDRGFEYHLRCAFILCLCCPVCRYRPCDGLIPRLSGPTDWGRVSPSTSVPLPIFIPTISPQSTSPIIWGWCNRPVVAAVPKVPPHKLKRKKKFVTQRSSSGIVIIAYSIWRQEEHNCQRNQQLDLTVLSLYYSLLSSVHKMWKCNNIQSSSVGMVLYCSSALCNLIQFLFIYVQPKV